jgi:hypothetical protein
MRFSYALTFGAVTLRLQIPIGFMLGYKSYSAMSVWLTYTAWIHNVLLVALYTLWDRLKMDPEVLSGRSFGRPVKSEWASGPVAPPGGREAKDRN